MLGLGLNIFTLAIRRYFGGGGGQFAGSSLNLDFTSGNQTLDPRITFTRASTGTRINASGVLVSESINGPRFDYDPVTLQPKGLLIEEQRTNSIRNSTMVGAVVGTPGTLPTNWNLPSGVVAGLTSAVVGIGAEDGIPYLDFRLSGTPIVTTIVDLAFDGANVISASNGQSWTQSNYVKLAGGSTTNDQVHLILTGRDSSGAFIASQVTTVVISPTADTLKSQRKAASLTMSSASVAFVQPRVRVTTTAGLPIDITLRIGLPQLELGAFATSPIPTTTAAATRAADVAVMTGANFSNWYRQDEGTVYGEFINLMPGSASASIQNAGLWAAADSSLVSTFNGYGVRIAPSVSTASAIQFTGRSGAVTQNATRAAIGFPSAGATYKTAASWDVSFMQFALNGQAGTAVTNTVAALLSAQNIFHIGSQTVGGSPPYALNGHIRKIACFPRRLTNSELQGLTS